MGEGGGRKNAIRKSGRRRKERKEEHFEKFDAGREGISRAARREEKGCVQKLKGGGGEGNFSPLLKKKVFLLLFRCDDDPNAFSSSGEEREKRVRAFGRNFFSTPLCPL